MKDMMKKNGFKRTTAFLMALSMVCSFPQVINASASFSDTSSDHIMERTYTDQKDAGDPTENIAIGRIEISLRSYIDLENDVEYTAKLTDSNGAVQTSVLISDSSNETKSAVFKNLADGEYIVEVSAPGFAAFRQNITVAQKMYTINLTAGFCNGYTYVDGGIHPGVLMIGDVNGDGKVDDADKIILVDTIDESSVDKEYQPELNYITDLNNDNMTNLIDLTYLSKSYKIGDKNTAAHIEESVSPEAVVPEIAEDTAVTEGSVEEMLNGEGSVTLTPAGGGEITKDNPVSIGFNLEEGDTVVDGITFDTSAENPVSQATIDVNYIDENGNDASVTIPYIDGIHHILAESEVYAEIDENGKLHVHFGAQVAVKKVTLTIMGMQKNTNLAEISKVEFVNGMESRIPEPEMDIPENLKATAGSEQFTVRWDPCLNVKGYQVQIEQGGNSQIIDTITNSITVTSFNGGDIKNYTTYKVSVQSVNGTWASGYCNAVNVTPKPNKRPDKPDGVSASGKYLSVAVSWKKMDDTKSYNVYYKERNSDEDFSKAEGITNNSFLIPDLKNLTEYEIYVTGVNELGESPQSIHCSATTIDPKSAEVPKYNMINRDENGIPGKSHIVSVTRNGGEMIESESDADLENTAWGAVDNDPASYYKKTTWDDGGFNNLGRNGLTYTFDDAYKIDTIIMTATDGMQYSYIHAKWWDIDGKESSVNAYCQQAKDSKGNIYHVIKLAQPVEAKKIQIGCARYLAGGSYNLITISDTYFYHYDDLRDVVMGLYADDLHTSLKPDVTQQTIDDIREKINTPDEFGIENPDKEVWLRELETAEKILNDESLNSAVEVHAGITSKDTGRGFSGLNAWQPLGVTAAAGETVTIYVGNPNKKTGDSTDLRLISTQYHSESGGVTTAGANLKIGANEIKIPDGSTVGFESGGALYVQYQGNNSNDRYSVRVSGGAEVPTLDLYKVTDENERMERAVEFVKELDEYVPAMESLHNEIHKDSENINVDMPYDRQNCILGASDIMLDTMMFSIPAQQMLAGIGTGSVEERAGKMLDSMQAMEDMMYLFYQHKGLNASAPNDLNRIPKGHLNIRYQRMFSGAFMYAAGNHIGIEWGSTPGMMNSVPVEADENGKYIGGRYFGWGIAHEIGHNINQGSYAVAEITNNYFAVLAQAKDTNDSVRFQYRNVYDKVTSGTRGNASNVFTQLGMYWQLHLAYDSGLNYKTYSDYNEQLENLFFARVDTYARNTKAAPAPNGIMLTLNGNTDQNLMRLACAAANKNVLEFFERWGKTPDAGTIAYAEQFEKETRAIFFANDDSRIYALNGSGSVLNSEGTVSAIDNVSVNIGDAPNKVDLRFTSKDIPESDILGYEIIRCTIEGGEVEETPVGFSTSAEFTDTVSTMNNRTVFYKVTLIDQYLNRSASFTTEAAKIEHDGSMDKTNWTISTIELKADAEKPDSTDEMPCEQTAKNPAYLAFDNDPDTVFTSQITAGYADITIDLNQTLTTSGMKITTGSDDTDFSYKIYVKKPDGTYSGNENPYQLVAEGSCTGDKTVYFANDDNKYISTYSTSSIKFVFSKQQNKVVSIAELDVLAPTGDNVDFRRTEDENMTVIGTLSEDYKYGENDGDVIPKDSLVFTGSYKGNPAYNVVMLFDGEGNIVGGIDDDNNLLSQQIILADVPDEGNIANVSDGTWIYWIEPDQMTNMEMPETVRVELYRVNNAQTNEGQRLVSDSLFEEVPDTLPDITFGK
mgnify:CR=1 FL=1